MDQLYKRGNVYWAWGYDRNGRRWQRSTKQRDKGAARIVAAQLTKELALEADQPGHKATLDDALSGLIESAERASRSPDTVEIMVQKGSHLARLLGKDTPCDLLNLDRTTKYAYKRLDEGASKHTVLKEIKILLQALRRASKLGRYKAKVDPSTLMPDELDGAYVPRERWLPPEEYQELLIELDPKRTKHTRTEDRRDYVVMFCQTGARDSELYKVVPGDCDFASREVVLNAGKGAEDMKKRRVPMTPAVEAVLRRRIEAQEKTKKKGPLFPPWGMVRGELSGACTRIEVRWNKDTKWKPPAHEGEEGARRKKAGLPPPKRDRVAPPKPFDPVTPNDLRRTFASWLAQAGVPLHHASKLMGHSSTAMLERVYARLAPQTLRDAIAKLPDSVTSKTGYEADGSVVEHK